MFDKTKLNFSIFKGGFGKKTEASEIKYNTEDNMLKTKNAQKVC